MRLLLKRFLICVGLLAVSGNFLNGASQWKAGVTKIQITPTNSIWLTGFAARTNVSRGKLHELHAKVLALEDSAGRKTILVTSDLLGFPAAVSENIAREIQRLHGISRDRLLLNSSHTHGAPALASPAHFIYGPQANPSQWQQIEEYTRELERKIVAGIRRALGNMKPAELSFGEGKATFGVNRRKMGSHGVQSFVPNPDGPVDHAVPVLRVNSGKTILALVFGYAAHPTTITGGPHYYDFSGDYAGFAQEMLEQKHSGAIAMFVQGCGGDVMVHPRGTVELAREYGLKLSSAVNSVLERELRPVNGPIVTAFEQLPVAFAPPPSRAELEERVKTGDLYHRWHAKEMLRKLEEGSLPKTYPYPVQVWQFGTDLTMIALAGEVVAHYSIRLKKELGGAGLWVAGYSNDLCCYIPSKRVLAEGGYEGEGAMIYYMQPAKFAPDVEERIIDKAREMANQMKTEKAP